MFLFVEYLIEIEIFDEVIFREINNFWLDILVICIELLYI